jgi:sugar phosphate isomerase/epimerase
VHERLCVSAVSSWSWSFEDDLAFWTEAGIDRVELSLRKVMGAAGVAAAPKEIRARGLQVASIIEVGNFVLTDAASWPLQRDQLRRGVELADATGARCVVVVPGRADQLEWEAAAGLLGDALGPVIDDASAAGVTLALEHTSPFRVDLSFLHRLRDAVDLAHMIGVGVCMEVQGCWAERNLNATIADSIDVLALVQVSDFVIGTLSTPDRVVPGDGDIPLERMISHVLASGYDGVFDVELVGPRIEEEGYRGAITRSVDYMNALLDRLLND